MVETPTYDLTVFQVHYSKMTRKIYPKGARVLRAEVMIHPAQAYRGRRSLPGWGEIVTHLLGMVRKIGSSRRYEPVPKGLRAMTALVVMREKVIQPLLAASSQLAPLSTLQHPTPIDRHSQKLRAEMRNLFTTLGVAA